MRVALWNHHTPYVRLLARALPEHDFYVRPTRHAPTAWRDDQRPRPENVHIGEDERGFVDWYALDPEVIICQTADDLEQSNVIEAAGSGIYLCHNRWEFEGHSVRPSWPTVFISEMKYQSAVAMGWHNPLHWIVPPYVNVDEYGGWTGEGGYILTVCNGLYRRLFDKASWLEATRGLPVKLVGEGNEGIPGAVGPAESWEQLKSYYRCARAYLSVNKWPNEDGYNLSLLEAAATGMPCVTLAKYPPGTDSTPQWTSMRFDAVPQVHGTLAYALQVMRDVDREQGAYGRECVARDFPLATFRQSWLRVLESVTA